MFRNMRRGEQALTEEESRAVLHTATAGVLAVSGDDGFPYAVPLSFVYHDHKIIFHCAKAGHKLDAIARSDKVSFCVIDQDQVVPEAYTTHYRSVVAFGYARVLEDEAEKRAALEVLAAKYTPDDAPGRQREIDRSLAHVCMVEIRVAHLTGKQAKELIRR